MALEDYFTDRQIIKILCHLRAELAKKRHDKQFLYNLSKAAPKPGTGELPDEEWLCQLLPPRRQWERPKYSERKHKSTVQANALAIERTVSRKRRASNSQQEPWLLELNRFIEDVKQKALHEQSYRMAEPRIHPVKKERNSENHEYRPIAIYGLVDRIIGGQCARYLREVFDEDFLDYSYAFRVKKHPDPDQNRCIDHHDAVEALIQYRTKYPNQALWVAECDIKGFFDCVHHDEARKALERARQRVESKGRLVDLRAIEIFESYLQSYSFTQVAISQADEYFKNKDPKGHLKKIESDLSEFWSDPTHEPIGIPQGGALSCLIANLMLDEADRQVLEDSSDLFYARYCDDMILVHPDHKQCENAFERYVQALKSLKLPRHPPQEVIKYGRDEYWNCKERKYKSKSPYQWAPKDENASVPWVGFVGYQVRYDGLIRIRPSSIEKELKKQVREAGKVLRVVCPKQKSNSEDLSSRDYSSQVRKSSKQICYRLHQRLIKMSVGRSSTQSGSIPLWQIYLFRWAIESGAYSWMRYVSSKVGCSPQSSPNKVSGFCWCSGFRLLKKYPFVASQLKQLDRGRERQLHRVERHIKNLGVASDARPRKGRKGLDYWGKPFSYCGQFSPHTEDATVTSSDNSFDKQGEPDFLID